MDKVINLDKIIEWKLKVSTNSKEFEMFMESDFFVKRILIDFILNKRKEENRFIIFFGEGSCSKAMTINSRHFI